MVRRAWIFCIVLVILLCPAAQGKWTNLGTDKAKGLVHWGQQVESGSYLNVFQSEAVIPGSELFTAQLVKDGKVIAAQVYMLSGVTNEVHLQTYTFAEEDGALFDDDSDEAWAQIHSRPPTGEIVTPKSKVYFVSVLRWGGAFSLTQIEGSNAYRVDWEPSF